MVYDRSMEPMEHFETITVFDNYEVLSWKKGEVIISTIVTEGGLNPYGFAHGGYLYTLADALAGRVSYSLGSYCVSLQGNVNYMKKAKLGDRLTVKGTAVHNGRSTKVIRVTIENEKEELLLDSTFTCYVLKQVDE